jgi:hypothetical protein
MSHLMPTFTQVIATSLAVIIPTLVGACASRTDELHPPTTVRAPYDTSRGEVLWAIAPLRNESGTTAVDPLAFADKLANAVGQVRGLRVIPVNRTLEVMRALNLAEISSHTQALQIATELGADAILVGSVTAYDPYNPPQIGVSLALVARPGHLTNASDASVPHSDIRYRSSEYIAFPRSQHKSSPISSFSSFLDAKNHQVQADLRTYAIGRDEGQSALGWRRYMASMDLYTEFAAWHSVCTLLEREWIRIARVGG